MQLGGRHLLLALGLGAIAQSVLAVGFGRLPSTATLGQPLQLSIPLRLEPDEEIRPECMSGTVSYADSVQQPGTTSLRLDPAPPGVTDRVLRLATTTRVDEPVVTVEVSIGCAARVVRRFTLFADPPVVTASEPLPSVATQEPSAPAPAGEPAVAASAPRPAPSPPTSTAQGGSSEPRARLRATAPPRQRSAVAAAGAAPNAKPRPAPRRPAESSSRLRLTPIEPSATLAAAATAAAAASAADAAASAAAAAAAQEAASAASAAAAARLRVEELEAAMKRLQADTSNTQQQIGSLQSRLQRAESDRYSNPLVYGLVALIALLLGLVLWLWRQRQQEAEAHAWLVQAAAEPKPRPRGPATQVDSTEDVATAEAIAFAPVPTLKAWVSKPNEVDGFDDTLAATRAGPMSMSGALTSPAPLATPQKREVSVEELIDLEQQAEFFVVLGQDTAAIDLLLGHLRSTAGNSPLPYLKLLEIYKRRGDRNDYEKLRERFNSRFNAYAPAWETDLQDGRSLDDYPTVIDRLQNLWAEPQRAMEVLQASLLRVEGGESGSTSAGSFDLPAYRELMLLYSVARDRSEAESGGAVDLLLPIGDVDAGEIHSGVFERLLATTTLPAQPDAQKPLEIDLTLEDLEPKPPGDERR